MHASSEMAMSANPRLLAPFMFDLKTLTEMNKRVAKAREEMRRKKVTPSWPLTKVTESRPSTRSATDK